MAKKQKNAITPTRAENYPEWYQQVVRAADLAENSPVRGCMIIKPWGYSLWENMQRVLDSMFKETGHVNAYFPLFIPLSFLEKEAEHVEGFAKECAVVTHYRLESSPEGKLVPAAKLEEPLIVRPTSETIIGEAFARWIQSYRDLPVLMNQWANIVRWEMRTRLFLRTSEFLWQEGHTAHETREEAIEETLKMLEVYRRFAEEYMAIPVITGEKSEGERFPGAENTYCIEAMMQDRKALQSGTSHFLGQNFSRAANIVFQTRDEKREHAWTTSWGVSTRLIGAIIMTHGDDNGMIMPPRLAPTQVVLLPVIHDEESREDVFAYCEEMAASLRSLTYYGRPVEAHIDRREMNAGEKSWDWIKKGVPLRAEIGPRDMKNNSVFVGRRDTMEKFSLTREDFRAKACELLDSIHNNLLERARRYRDEHTREIRERSEFEAFFTPQNREQPEIHGGFALSPWCGSIECEKTIAEKLSVTIRCLPLEDRDPAGGECVGCGNKATVRAVFARAY